MPEPVACLFPHERIWLDPVRIGALYAELGPSELPAMIDRAIHELLVVHGELGRHYAGHDLAGFARGLRRLVRIAGHLSLPVVVQIGADVTTCLDRGDAAALAATWGRLDRSIDQLRRDGWNGDAG